MDNVLEYKGYYAKIEYSAKDQLVYGKIEGINDLVSFESDSLSKINDEFIAAVDDYLDYCIRCGKEPDKTYKGTFNIRISPELHKEIATIAIKNSISLNELVSHAIELFVHPNKAALISQLLVSNILEQKQEYSENLYDVYDNSFIPFSATYNH